MNDLMTKSFLSYVELKKQAMMDLEAGPDIEMGQLDPTDERNLTKFFEEVAVIKSDMEEISNLLVNLQDLNQKTKSAPSAKILQGLRDQINSDIITVLRKAKIIKTRLELLDKSNLDNRGVSAAYKEGSPVDRTRISVTNGLRIKLRDMMNDFQCLRENIVAEHKEGLRKQYSSEGLRKQYSSANRKEPSEEAIEKMMQEKVFEGRVEKGVVENQDRHEAVKEIQKSLVELHQVFLDMAVMVETQGDQMNNIEQNVVNAGGYVNGGMKELDRANRMKRTRTWACWIGALVLVFLLICLIAILF
ncbi:syntaxin-112-like [Solanum stenotomum]|uniref:syntaxin-112-like n=1 Tax=Solanum stenotomum TaxID=172797 RepID=UPI0020D106DB|nr:syntaxin-112-like [Solanum stenotomum]